MSIVSQLVSSLPVVGSGTASPVALAVTASSVLLALYYLLFHYKTSHNGHRLPPEIPYTIPWVGPMVSFGVHPINFLLENRKKLGDIFMMQMLGRKVVYLFGQEGHKFLFEGQEHILSAQKAYAPVTVPVFGPNVVYDVSYSVLTEQKRMVKGGLTTAAFRSYVSDIQEEVHQYFARWGNEGEADLYSAMCELVINTASRTLLGQDVRSQLNDEVARLYHDLDLGFTPINFLFPNLPLPRNIVRDRANLQLRELFVSVLRKRAARLEKLKAEGKEDSEVHHDMLNSLMNATYKDGRSLSEVEVAGLMIALLMAGQHTSSTSATWFGLYLLRDKEYLAKVMAEQESIFGDGKGGYVPLDFEGISNCDRLEYVLKEVLRLCPPIFQIMRTVTEDVYFNDMVIPAGSYVAVSPSVSSLDGKAFPNPNTFDPDRFSPERAEDSTEKNKGLYVPFGHGRHRCIGEPFAYLQIKTIWAAILQTFELEPVGPMNQPNFNSMIVLPETPCMVRYKRRVPL